MNKREEALDFLKTNRTGVLATLSPAGDPHARLVYYAADDDFNIHFLTLASTRKAADLTARPVAAFTVASTDIPRTLQIEGTVEDVTETATIDPILARLTENLFSNAPFYAPLTHFDQAAMRMYRLRPTWIRWGDFTHGVGEAEIFTVIPLA